MKNRFEICGDYTEIILSRKDGSKLKTLINTEDLLKADELSGSWYAIWNPHTQSFYVDGHYGKTTVKLHRWILDAPKGMVVDHIDHDTLDNRRSNIRVVTPSENLFNRIKPHPTGSSGVLGVNWLTSKNQWGAVYTWKGRKRVIGRFDTVEEAEKAITKARQELVESLYTKGE